MLPQLRADVADALCGGSTPPPAFSTIVDNTTAGRFTASANWLTSSYSAERYGADYRYTNPEPISDVAWYRANIPAEGTYRVDAWYPGITGYRNAGQCSALQGGGEGLRWEGRQGPGSALSRTVLLLDVLFHDAQWCPADGPGEV